jgi:hypothetical protein
VERAPDRVRDSPYAAIVSPRTTHLQPAHSTIDSRLLAFWSELVLCSRCLCRGIRRAVPQMISPRHKPLTLCRSCREQRGTH